MKYVTSYGGLWRLSDRAYKALCKKIERGETFDLDQLGKPLGNVETLDGIREEVENAQ